MRTLTNPSHVRTKNLVKFGELTKQFFVISTHARLDNAHHTRRAMESVSSFITVISPKFNANNFGAKGRNLTIFFHVTISYVTFQSQMSPERIEQSRSGKRRYLLLSLSRSTQKNGELWSIIKRVNAAIFYHPEMNTARAA